MSDVLIKGMKMPARCELCQFSGISGKSCELISCTFTGKHRYFNDGQYMDGCPLVELPPHGRLVDADALVGQFTPDELYYRTEEAKKEYDEHKLTLREIRENIVCQPTIIESEEET